MTIWAAYANFEEKERGSIEVGKMADFILTDKDLMQIKNEEMRGVKVLKTVIGGEVVYSLIK